MQRTLKAGKYRTNIGLYQLLEDSREFAFYDGEYFFKMIDENGQETIVPLSNIISEEDGAGESYSTPHTTAAGDSYEGTDTIGGTAKPIKKVKTLKQYSKKKSKKKPIVMKRS